MILRSPTENENEDFVIPVWIAGIQIRKDACGNVRVDLDSSPPCWNDGIEGRCFKLSETAVATFSKEYTKAAKGWNILDYNKFRVLRGDIHLSFDYHFAFPVKALKMALDFDAIIFIRVCVIKKPCWSCRRKMFRNY